MLYDYDRDDPNFVADLYESQKYVELAATWLRRHGYVVEVNKVRVRPDPSQMSEYADKGDLKATGMFDGKHQTKRVEVKHRPAIHFLPASLISPSQPLSLTLRTTGKKPTRSHAPT